MARSASDDELVPPAMQGSQVHLENVHRGVVDIEKICEVQNHDLGGVRSRDALGIGDAFQFTYRTEKEGARHLPGFNARGHVKGQRCLYHARERVHAVDEEPTGNHKPHFHGNREVKDDGEKERCHKRHLVAHGHRS